MISLLWLFACHSDPPLAPSDLADVSVEIHLTDKRAASGEAHSLEVAINTRKDWVYQEFLIEIDGVAVEAVDSQYIESSGGNTANYRYALNAPDGSYVLEPIAFSFAGPDGELRTRESQRLFFDFGDEGPSSPIDAMVPAPPEPVSPWPNRIRWILAGMLLLALLGVLWKKRPKKQVPVVPPVPPDLEALAAWQKVQSNPDLDDHMRALLLSQIYRRYLERRFVLPASAYTTAEVLGSLRGVLTERHIGQSKRLLTATDRIKYARRGGGLALFTSLDEDLRELIASTRQRRDVELSEND
mgnify:CR=1 FL=1